MSEVLVYIIQCARYCMTHLYNIECNLQYTRQYLILNVHDSPEIIVYSVG